MACIGVKLGCHGVRLAQREPTGVVSPLEPGRLSIHGVWYPVLSMDLYTGEVGWDSGAWNRVEQVAYFDRSLLEHLSAGERVMAGEPVDPVPVLTRTLWHALVDEYAEEAHDVCIASTVPITPALREALVASAPERIRLYPERVLDVSLCTLIAHLAGHTGAEVTRVLHLHLGGRAAQAHLWEAQTIGGRWELHRLAREERAEGGLGALYSRIFDASKSSWGLLNVEEDVDDGDLLTFRIHFLGQLARGRADWYSTWTYEPPAGMLSVAQWVGPTSHALQQEKVEQLLDATAAEIHALIDRVLEAGGVSESRLDVVIATGGGATPEYFLPSLRRRFSQPGRLPRTEAEELPARGAALAAAALSGQGGPRWEAREGLLLGVELKDQAFDPLVALASDTWQEVVRVYDVPPDISELRLRLGLRDFNRLRPPVAVLQIPPALARDARLALRLIRRNATEWQAQLCALNFEAPAAEQTFRVD